MTNTTSDIRPNTDSFKFISWEAVALLFFGLSTGRVVSTTQLATFFHPPTETVLWSMSWLTVFIDTITVVGFFVLILIEARSKQQSARRRSLTIMVVVAVMMGTILFHQLFFRQQTRPFLGTFDGAVQTEVAAQELLHGHNPYTFDFTKSIFKEFLGPIKLHGVNLADQHFAYPPLLPVLTILTIPLGRFVGAPAEFRIIPVVSLLFVILLLCSRTRSWTKRTIIVLLIANPFFSLYALAGYSDGVAASLLVISAMMLVRQKWIWSAVVLGLAVASKQSVWLAVPLWFIWWWKVNRGAAQNNRWMPVMVFIGTALVFYAPFIVANGHALYDDIIRFPSAVQDFTYPIGGSSWWQFGVILKGFHSPWQHPPARLLQILFGLPTLLFVGHQMWRRPSINMWLGGTVVVTLVVGIWNPYFYEQYALALAFLLVCVMLIDWVEGR